MLWFWIFLAAALLVFYLILFGSSSFHRGTVVETLAVAVQDAPSAFAKLCLTCCLGRRRGLQVHRRIHKYLWEERNPLMMLVYNILIIGGYSIFLIFGQPLVPRLANDPSIHNNRVDEMDGVKIGLAVAIGYCLFLRTCMSDPGRVTAENVDRLIRYYPYDNILYSPNVVCNTCKLRKPARSKHCRYLGYCVARYDHYCPWFGTTIGARNLRYFVIFLFYHAFLCGYAGLIIYRMIQALIDKRRLWEAEFIHSGTGTVEKATPLIVFQYMMSQDIHLVSLDILLIVFSLVLMGFALYHLYLVAIKGTTSNELAKWEDYQEFAQEEIKRRFGGGKMPPNMYQRHGVWKNLRDIFLVPPSLF